MLSCDSSMTITKTFKEGLGSREPLILNKAKKCRLFILTEKKEANPWPLLEFLLLFLRDLQKVKQ